MHQDPPLMLLDLLGPTRAELVDLLRTQARSVAELAQEVGLSEVAVRRHLQVLERDSLVRSETVRGAGRGRPGARYRLTGKGVRLFPDRSAEVANELVAFLEQEHGRAALLRFLRWRQERQGARYAAALDAVEPGRRVQRLAELLTEDGFLAEAVRVPSEDGGSAWELRQGHCAIHDVARENPEFCTYEAALFKRLLGGSLSRRQTIAAGGGECVCRLSAAAEDPPGGGAPRAAQTQTTAEIDFSDAGPVSRARPPHTRTTRTGAHHGDDS